MTNSILQIFSDQLAELKKSFPDINFISKGQEESFIADEVKKSGVELINNQLRFQRTGAKADPKQIVYNGLIAKGYLKYQSPQYVVPWTSIPHGKYKDLVYPTIKRALELRGVRFVDQKSENEVLKELSEHFIAADSPNGPQFYKTNQIGLLSKPFSTDDLINEIKDFIDHDKTRAARLLHEYSLREKATQMEGPESKNIPATIEKLRAIELRSINPGRTVPVQTGVEQEFERKAKLDMGKPEELFTLKDLQKIKNEVNANVSKLSDLSEFRQRISAIQKEQPKPYPGL